MTISVRKFPSCIVVGAVALVAAGGGYFYGRQSVLSDASAATKAHAATGNNKKSSAAGANATAGADGMALDNLLHSKGKPDAALLAAWAKNLSPEERAAAFAQLQGMASGQQRNALLAAVVDSWAAGDPAGFLASTSSVTNPQMRETGVDAAIKAWAAQNPQDALKWLKDNPGSAPNSALDSRFAAAIAGFASVDPKGAFDAVSALTADTPKDAQLKSQALQALTTSLADQGMYSDAIAMFNQLPAGAGTSQAYNNLATRWASDDPGAAASWVSSLTDPQMRASMGGQVVATWAASDPQSAAAWAAQMDQQPADPNNPNAANNSNLLANAITTWANYDLDAAGNFLNTLPPSVDKDGAVATFALNAAQEDPAGAMNWVNSISNDQTRNRLAMITALQWQQSDPDGYGQFMATSNVLTDQQKQQLNNIPPLVGTLLSGLLNAGSRASSGTTAGAGANGSAVNAQIQNYIINGAAGGNRNANAAGALQLLLGGAAGLRGQQGQ